MSHPVSVPARIATLCRAALSLPILIFWHACPSGAYGQQTTSEPPADAAVTLAPIVVSATGIPTPAAQIASSVTVVTAEEIESEQRRTVPDVLQRVPGLNVVQTGGPGGQTSVFVRGTNSNHVKVLIDGIDVSDPSNPNRSFDFGQLLTEDIARIEVLRGPQSGLYGADALGGVISVTTKRGEGPPKATVRVEGGSFGTFNQTGSFAGSTERFSYAFNVAHYHSEATPVTPLYLLPPGRRANDNNYDNATYSTKLAAELSDLFSVNFVGRYTDSTLLYTSDSGFPSFPDADRSTQLGHQGFARAELVGLLFDGRLKSTLGAAYSNVWTSNQAPDTRLGPMPPTINIGERVKYDWRGDLNLFDGHTLLMGIQKETEYLDTKTIRAQNGNKAGFLELQSEWAKRVFLVSNVRYDDNDSFGGHITWRIAPAVLVPGTETKLKGTIGTGFKAPTLNQLFVSFPEFNFLANPSLKPEESLGYDLGFEQPLANGPIRFGATYFHNDIKNLIAANATFTSNENIGRATTYGAEAFVSYAFSEELSARLDYTNAVTKDEIAHHELLRRPRNKASVQLAWKPSARLSLSATAIYLGSRVDGNRDFSIPRLRAPGYTIVNLAANYAATENLTLFGRIDNLFNRYVEDPVGYRRPGFGAYVGLRVTN